MASIQQTIVFPTTDLTATTTGATVTVVPRSKRIIGRLIVTVPSANVTVAAVIQHSADNVTWFTYLSFTTTGAGATANQIVYPTNDAVLPYVRAVMTLGGAITTCTCFVDFFSETYSQ